MDGRTVRLCLVSFWGPYPIVPRFSEGHPSGKGITMNPQIFREYDIRGLVDKDLTVDVVEKLGLGLGTVVRRKGGTTVVVGRDCRESSTRFREALCRGLNATGISVL